MIFFKVSTIYLNIVHLQQWLNQYKYQEHILIIHKVSFGQNFGWARESSLGITEYKVHCIPQIGPLSEFVNNWRISRFVYVCRIIRIDQHQSEKPSIDPSNVSTKRLAVFNSSTDIRWVREGHFAQSLDDIIHVWSWMKVIYLYSIYYLLW